MANAHCLFAHGCEDSDLGAAWPAVPTRFEVGEGTPALKNDEKDSSLWSGEVDDSVNHKSCVELIKARYYD